MSTRNPRRADFPLLAANPQLHYLDSAATSQKPRVVLDAMRAYYERDNANPHRGAYALSARATDRYHDARERVAAFLGASDADCLVFTRGTTESLNLVATAWGHANVREGDEIVVTALARTVPRPSSTGRRSTTWSGSSVRSKAWNRAFVTVPRRSRGSSTTTTPPSYS